jgi:tRNA (cytidine/uridine-2'-O-)-methyltransferase
MDIILYQPEIPPNTGNIIRLCANTGAQLHLVKPLGFELHNRQLKRAGLDYHDLSSIQVHESWHDCIQHFCNQRIFAITTRGTVIYSTIQYQTDDALLFGPETRGLPQELLETISPAHRLKIPMRPQNRSLNLSNAAAIVLFEAWRQLNFY